MDTFLWRRFNIGEPSYISKQSDVNDFELMMFDKLLAFDQVMHKLCIIVNARTADSEAGYNKAVEEIDAFIRRLFVLQNRFLMKSLRKHWSLPVISAKKSIAAW